MKNENKKQDTSTAKTRPQRVLLHMAEKDGDWSGKATNFSYEEQYTFHGLDDLFEWLNERRESKDKNKGGK